ncbi:unnamed protein product [Meloidogyne enterolobii]|uniref:Uncharacterized protein n=1 Tax=Meloidogyne enterolobii TaxID=390850 RepID=A0ACB0Y2H2_MELEN
MSKSSLLSRDVKGIEIGRFVHFSLLTIFKFLSYFLSPIYYCPMQYCLRLRESRALIHNFFRKQIRPRPKFFSFLYNFFSLINIAFFNSFF